MRTDELLRAGLCDTDFAGWPLKRIYFSVLVMWRFSAEKG